MDQSPNGQTDILKHIETPDYSAIRDAFCRQLKEASLGKSNDLAFLKNQLPSKSLVKPGEIFQVFVIGGTNGETATVKYNTDGTISIEDYQAYPNLEKFKTAADFLTFIDKHVDSICNAIGINFAFSMEPKPGNKGQLDGVMLKGDDKGHELIGLEGKLVGETVEKYFADVHNRNIIASVGNDVVCLITAITSRDTNFEQLVSGIVGTGYNMSFFQDSQTIIDVESAKFKGFKQTATGIRIDQLSTNKGIQLYEKEVAAGELYKHFNLLIKDLNLQIYEINTSKELAQLAVTDKNIAGELARELLKRSASLVAAHFAGFYNFRNRPDRLTAIMQGSLFWEGPNYKEMFVEQLVRLGVPIEAIMFEMLERSGIIGAAKLITGGM